MSNTTTYRYEVSNKDYGVIEHARTFEKAKSIAQNWIERTETGVNLPVDGMSRTAEIFDRMAHKNKPELWNVSKCTGAAHNNPFIDHCGVCMPNWGIVVKPVAREIK